jgi:hypothetical protein
LAARQAELVAALVAGGPVPAGFDRHRVAATHRALVDKRRAAVARAWPALADTPGFADRFAAFAADRPPAGSRADGIAFAAAVRTDLAEDARAELLLATTARRFALRVDRHPRGPTLVLLRLPGLGPRIRTLRRRLSFAARHRSGGPPRPPPHPGRRSPPGP